MKKTMKKLLPLLLAVVMSLAFAGAALATTQTEPATTPDTDNASISINNPAKGETYTIYKLFDATVNGDKIAYQGTVPESLKDFFEADAQGNITPKGNIVDKDDQGNITGTHMTDELKAALETWAKSTSGTATAESNGAEELKFTGLPYGYYVMVTTHKSDPVGSAEAKSAISVTSTQPDASIYDKNVNTPTAKKEVGKESYSIGDTVEYTATFDTTNYMGEGENARQVVEYVIEDTLPAYLSDATVTSITVGGTSITPVQQFDDNKKITLEWATKGDDGRYTSKYPQGAEIVIEYEATLTSTTNINKADKNTIKITPQTVKDDGTDKKPWDQSWSDDAEITTYAAALKKTDGSSALKGAEFTIKGLTVTETESGVYTVVSYNPAADAAESAALKTDDNGKLYIVGLASDVELTVTETKAPEGYNKLTESKKLAPQVLNKQLYKTSGYEKYDADGNLIEHKTEETTDYTQVTKNLNELDAAALEIVNKQGTLLPSTGGIGTTIFYIAGSALVLVAGAALFARRVARKQS